MQRIRPIALWGAALVLFSVSTPGCARREKDPAVVAYERFTLAVRSARAELVWKMITPESRSKLSTSLGLSADTPAEQAALVLGIRPGWQFELDLPEQARLEKDQSGEDRRVVLGPLAGRTWHIVVRKVEADWLVDLIESRPVEG